jgi:integrase
MRGPRVFPQESLPSGPSWENVRNLIADCESDRPVDIRNRAILLLLSVCGFRAGEVIRMQLEDFDWKQDRISVTRSKNHRTHIYPLCQSVGTAVCRYLRDVRPVSRRREVFLTIPPPIRRLTQTALSALVVRKLKGLGVPLSHYGPHALRHSCATHLLSKGLTLKEIGDHLGHRLPVTTAIYTKVDLTGLREVADFDLGDLI